MSQFDPESLLSQELQTDEIETSYTPVPEGEFEFEFGKPAIASGEKDGKAWARLTLPCVITDPEVIEEMGVEKPTARFSFFLDLDESGQLEKGTNKNIKLGQAFEAVGIDGDATIAQLEGGRGICKVKHQMYEDQPQANVVSVTAP